jgi:hypothetical protein
MTAGTPYSCPLARIFRAFDQPPTHGVQSHIARRRDQARLAQRSRAKARLEEPHVDCCSPRRISGGANYLDMPGIGPNWDLQAQPTPAGAGPLMRQLPYPVTQ